MIKNKLSFMLLGIGLLLCTFLQDSKGFGGVSNGFWMGLFVVILVGISIWQVMVYLNKR